MSVLREGKCSICGRTFIYDQIRKRKLTCSDECHAERKRIVTLEYKKKVRDELRAEKQKAPRKKKVKPNLNRDLIEARKRGLT